MYEYWAQDTYPVDIVAYGIPYVPKCKAIVYIGNTLWENMEQKPFGNLNII